MRWPHRIPIEPRMGPWALPPTCWGWTLMALLSPFNCPGTAGTQSSPHPATDLVGELSWGQADWSGAAADHRLAIDSGGAEHAIQAAARLRTFDGQPFFSDEKIWAFRLIIESGHPNWSPAAALKLAGDLAAMDDYEAAVSAYRLAFESGHPTHKPIAALNLGFLLEEQDDRVGAATAYQVAIDSGDPDAASIAAAALEQLTQDPDEVKDAEGPCAKT